MTDPGGPGGNERYLGSRVALSGGPHGYRVESCVRAAEAAHLHVSQAVHWPVEVAELMPPNEPSC